MPWRRLVPYADPLHAGRHPFQTYLLSLCFVTGIPGLFGYVGSPALREALPLGLSIAWSVMLVFGSAAGLLGSYWRGDLATAMSIEKLGLFSVGVAACIFALIIPMYLGFVALLTTGIVAAFGLSCLRRSRDISKIFDRAIRERHSHVTEEEAWRRLRGEE
jgi:hypothetical protein